MTRIRFWSLMAGALAIAASAESGRALEILLYHGEVGETVHVLPEPGTPGSPQAVKATGQDVIDGKPHATASIDLPPGRYTIWAPGREHRIVEISNQPPDRQQYLQTPLAGRAFLHRRDPTHKDWNYRDYSGGDGHRDASGVADD